MSVCNKPCPSSTPDFITAEGRRKWYGSDEGNEKRGVGMNIRDK
jgi:hypothetical protein